MRDDPQFVNLLAETWRDLQSAEVLWQLATLAGCLFLAWLLGRVVLNRVAPATDEVGGVVRLGRSGLRRALFPLLALLFVLSARPVLSAFHHVNLLNLAVPLLTSLVVIRIVILLLREAIGRTSWIAGFERVFVSVVWTVVALHIVGWLPEVLDALEALSVTVGGQRLSLLALLKGTVIVLLTLLVAMWLASRLEQRLMGAVALSANARLVLIRVAKTLLILVAVLVVLPMLGIDLTTLSVFGGALGVGLGFGLQKIAANYVSGFIILLDRSLRIGNTIAVGTQRGVVTEINTRYTVIRAGNGVESLVPNETLIGTIVQNETFTDTSLTLSLNFQVAYGSDVERAMAILVEVAQAHSGVLAEPAPKAFFSGFGDSGITLRLNVGVVKPEEGTLGMTSDINLAVWRRFREAQIEFPLPQREVHLQLPAERGGANPGALPIRASRPERPPSTG